MSARPEDHGYDTSKWTPAVWRQWREALAVKRRKAAGLPANHIDWDHQGGQPTLSSTEDAAPMAGADSE